MTLEITKPEELKEVYQLIIQDGFYTGGSIETLIPRIEVKELYSLREDQKLIGVGFIDVLLRTPTYADIAMIIDEKKAERMGRPSCEGTNQQMPITKYYTYRLYVMLAT